MRRLDHGTKKLRMGVEGKNLEGRLSLCRFRIASGSILTRRRKGHSAGGESREKRRGEVGGLHSEITHAACRSGIESVGRYGRLGSLKKRWEAGREDLNI